MIRPSPTTCPEHDQLLQCQGWTILPTLRCDYGYDRATGTWHGTVASARTGRVRCWDFVDEHRAYQKMVRITNRLRRRWRQNRRGW